MDDYGNSEDAFRYCNMASFTVEVLANFLTVFVTV